MMVNLCSISPIFDFFKQLKSFAQIIFVFSLTNQKLRITSKNPFVKFCEMLNTYSVFLQKLVYIYLIGLKNI